MDEIITAGQSIIDFISTGSYTFVQAMFAWLTIKLVYWWFYLKLQMLEFFWGVGLSIINQLNISDTINTYWGYLDSEILALATYLNLPDALNFVINARITRFIMDLF